VRTPSPSFALIALLCGLTALPCEANAVDFELTAGLFNRFGARRNEVERQLRFDANLGRFAYDRYLAPVNDTTQYSLLLAVSAQLTVTKWLSFGLAADSGLLRPADLIPAQTATAALGQPALSTNNERAVTANGQPVADEAKNTAFIRQAFVELAAPETRFFDRAAGRLAAALHHGLIYDDFGLGAHLHVDLERLDSLPLAFDLKLLLPTRNWTSGLSSPLASLRVAYVFSSLLDITESIGISLTYYHDGNDNFGNVLRPLMSETAASLNASGPKATEAVAYLTAASMQSRANLIWLALDGRKLIGDFDISGTLIVGLGQLRLDNTLRQDLQAISPEAVTFLDNAKRLPPKTIEVDVLGFAVDLSVSYLLTERLSLGAFFLYLSGDENFYAEQRLPDRYGSFFWCRPLLDPRQHLLFGGIERDLQQSPSHHVGHQWTRGDRRGQQDRLGGNRRPRGRQQIRRALFARRFAKQRTGLRLRDRPGGRLSGAELLEGFLRIRRAFRRQLFLPKRQRFISCSWVSISWSASREGQTAKLKRND
jgi:hypothetical protein